MGFHTLKILLLTYCYRCKPFLSAIPIQGRLRTARRIYQESFEQAKRERTRFLTISFDEIISSATICWESLSAKHFAILTVSLRIEANAKCTAILQRYG